MARSRCSTAQARDKATFTALKVVVAATASAPILAEARKRGMAVGQL